MRIEIDIHGNHYFRCFLFLRGQYSEASKPQQAKRVKQPSKREWDEIDRIYSVRCAVFSYEREHENNKTNQFSVWNHLHVKHISRRKNNNKFSFKLEENTSFEVNIYTCCVLNVTVWKAEKVGWLQLISKIRTHVNFRSSLTPLEKSVYVFDLAAPLLPTNASDRRTHQNQFWSVRASACVYIEKKSFADNLCAYDTLTILTGLSTIQSKYNYQRSFVSSLNSLIIKRKWFSFHCCIFCFTFSRFVVFRIV